MDLPPGTTTPARAWSFLLAIVLIALAGRLVGLWLR